MRSPARTVERHSKAMETHTENSVAGPAMKTTEREENSHDEQIHSKRNRAATARRIWSYRNCG